MLRLIRNGETEAVIGFLTREVGKLARAGADLALFASNTPHLYFDELQRRSSLPLISIVEATCDAAVARGLKRVALLGTQFTMQGGTYPAALARRGIALVLPTGDEQTYIHDRYMAELVNSVFLATTRDRLLAIIGRLTREEQVDGVILGGTELPLILVDGSSELVPFLDTTHIHVQRALDRILT
jgi:aspartate racemase